MLAKNLLSVFLSAVVAAAVSCILSEYFNVVNTYWHLSLLYYCLLFFMFNLVYQFKAGSTDFTGLLLGGIIIKLLLAFFIVFAYAFLKLPAFAQFSGHFIAHYILFTIFEIRYLTTLINTTASHEKNKHS